MSFNWLPAYSDIVGLAVALVQRQRLPFCVAKHMVCYFMPHSQYWVIKMLLCANIVRNK